MLTAAKVGGRVGAARLDAAVWLRGRCNLQPAPSCQQPARPPSKCPSCPSHPAASQPAGDARSTAAAGCCPKQRCRPTTADHARPDSHSHHPAHVSPCRSAQVPSVARVARQAVSDGTAVAVGLHSMRGTGEADITAVCGAAPRETSWMTSPTILRQFISQHFPLKLLGAGLSGRELGRLLAQARAEAPASSRCGC